MGHLQALSTTKVETQAYLRVLSCPPCFYYVHTAAELLKHGVVCMDGVSRKQIAHLWAQLKLSISIFLH